MENNTNSPQPKISTPMAIIAAGVLIMIAILATKGGVMTSAPKTLSEEVGVSKESLNACIQATDLEGLSKKIDESVDKAMSAYPKNERGTPFSIVIGKNGVMTDIRGADSYVAVKKVVDDAKLGTVVIPHKGEVPPVNSDEHIYGNPNAEVTIIEYSDFECPFCKQFSPALKKIVDESNGMVRLVYRHYPLHQHSFEKLVAAECIAKIKGNDAYWQYSDLLFGLLKTGNESVSEQL